MVCVCCLPMTCCSGVICRAYVPQPSVEKRVMPNGPSRRCSSRKRYPSAVQKHGLARSHYGDQSRATATAAPLSSPHNSTSRRILTSTHGAGPARQHTDLDLHVPWMQVLQRHLMHLAGGEVLLFILSGLSWDSRITPGRYHACHWHSGPSRRPAA